MSKPAFIIEEVSDTHETARVQAQDERHQHNNAWLQVHVMMSRHSDIIEEKQ